MSRFAAISFMRRTVFSAKRHESEEVRCVNFLISNYLLQPRLIYGHGCPATITLTWHAICVSECGVRGDEDRLKGKFH